jgi:hypothetical protein
VCVESERCVSNRRNTYSTHSTLRSPTTTHTHTHTHTTFYTHHHHTHTHTYQGVGDGLLKKVIRDLYSVKQKKMASLMEAHGDLGDVVEELKGHTQVCVCMCVRIFISLHARQHN